MYYDLTRIARLYHNNLYDIKSYITIQAGREILIKAVVQAIPTYSMSVFRLPKKLCSSLNSMITRFWWGHSNEAKHISWMSWGRLGKSKLHRGMGFRDLEAFNVALLAKQG
jgi:hypothetical protein